MCERQENEPMMVYLLRYVVEQPRAILALIGFIAAGYMYFDLMAFVRENTASMRDIGEQVRTMSEQVREANTRLQHLEREHEAARMGGAP